MYDYFFPPIEVPYASSIFILFYFFILGARVIHASQVVSSVALLFTFKKKSILMQKKNYGKLKYFTMQKM
jgi:hypothetical protein